MEKNKCDYEYDLSGKTVIPFNTHAGYGVRSGFQSVKKLMQKEPNHLNGLILESL